ncbi:MAG: hypothetical protein P1V97_36990 [Planctomycetota bacterium]|nr:hypothetical protein [Planctomycetota bacterium]
MNPRQLLSSLSLVFLFTACSAEKKAEPEPEKLAPAVIRENPKPKPKPKAKPKPKPKPKPELTFEQKLELDLKKAEELYKETEFRAAVKILADRLGDRDRNELLGKSDDLPLTRAAQLEFKSKLGVAFAKFLPSEIYRNDGARALFTNSNGREFVGWIIEDYKGSADSEEIEDLNIVRLDGLKAKLPKNAFQYKRLKYEEWLGFAVAWLNDRAEKYNAEKNTMAAFRLMERALAWGAQAEVSRWMETAIATDESEILITLYTELPKAQDTALKDQLAAFTNKRSRMKKVILARRSSKKKATPAKKVEPKKAVKTPGKEVTNKEPVQSTKEVFLTTSEDSGSGESLTPNEIVAIYQRGLDAYKQTRGRQEQKKLKEAQKHFERAMEAWNTLGESDPAAASKLEARMSEISVLLYDCVKRRKLR